MSRKSKATIFKERLALISDSPCDFFDTLPPEQDWLDEVRLCEQGDVGATDRLSRALMDECRARNEANHSLMYFLKKGVALGSIFAARAILECINIYGEGYESLENAEDIIRRHGQYDELAREINHAKIKRIVSAVSRDADFKALNDMVSSVDKQFATCISLYLLSLEERYSGKIKPKERERLCYDPRIVAVLSLPIFAAGVEPISISEEDAPKYALNLSSALWVCDSSEWQDFWIQCIYEYSVLYHNSDFSPLYKDVLQVMRRRKHVPKRDAHLLAWVKYAIEKAENEDEREELCREERELAQKCIYSGLGACIADENMSELRNESAYSSETEARVKRLQDAPLGHKILHTKNRYALTADLDGHLKRANRHTWEITLSIAASEQDVIKFSPLKVASARSSITRNGISLPYDKHSSQILLDSEIIINEIAHPFEIDLALDISYVSATKCAIGEIKVRSERQDTGVRILDCQLCIY